MGLAYASRMACDATGDSMQDFPTPFPAQKAYGASAGVSSVITLTENTTTIEVAAIGGTGVVLKWIAASDTQASVIATGSTANYDNVVPANWRQRFVVPIATQGIGNQSVVGKNVQNGLYKRVAVIATAPAASGPSSVFLAEFS